VTYWKWLGSSRLSPVIHLAGKWVFSCQLDSTASSSCCGADCGQHRCFPDGGHGPHQRPGGGRRGAVSLPPLSCGHDHHPQVPPRAQGRSHLLQKGRAQWNQHRDIDQPGGLPRASGGLGGTCAGEQKGSLKLHVSGGDLLRRRLEHFVK
jgi:hypothetical protein